MPAEDEKQTYRDFITPFVVEAEVPEVKAALPGGSNVSDDQIDSCNGEGEDEDSEEYLEMARAQANVAQYYSSTSTLQVDSLFREWIFTFVSHVRAMRTLQNHVKQLSRGPDLIIKFYLVSVKREWDDIGSWEDMKKSIRELTKGEIEPEAVANACIMKFEETIRSLRGLQKSKPNDLRLRTNAARILIKKGLLKALEQAGQSEVPVVPSKLPKGQASLGIGRPVMDNRDASSATKEPPKEAQAVAIPPDDLVFTGNQHSEANLAALIRQFLDGGLEEIAKRTKDKRLQELIAVCSLPIMIVTILTANFVTAATATRRFLTILSSPVYESLPKYLDFNLIGTTMTSVTMLHCEATPRVELRVY